MNAVPPSMTPGALSHGSQSGASVSGVKWTALLDAANVVAGLAGLELEHATPEIRDFPALMRNAAPWRRELAGRGIDDMAAVMEPGIAALLGVHARGADPRAAALALWKEFTRARNGVLALLPPDGPAEPRYST